jgi:hypothetical protein
MPEIVLFAKVRWPTFPAEGRNILLSRTVQIACLLLLTVVAFCNHGFEAEIVLFVQGAPIASESVSLQGFVVSDLKTVRA